MSLIGLKYGSTGPEVIHLKRLLAEQGAYVGTFSEVFGPTTEGFIKTFQAQHLGPEGAYLRVDGVVGANTAWALENPAGDAQRNFIDPVIPDGVEGQRLDTLNLLIGEHRKGVKETSTNWGPEIKGYGGQPGWAWCSLFVTWGLRQAKVIDFKQASTWSLLQWAIESGKARGIGVEPDKAVWQPGNLLLWQHQSSNGAWTKTGHVSMIVRIETRNGLVTRVNTVGGNEGNRVKFGIRDVWESDDLVAIIDPYTDGLVLNFEYGLKSGSAVEGDSTR